jgi:hypothetical protein
MQFRCHESGGHKLRFIYIGRPGFDEGVTTPMTLDARGTGMTLTGPARASRLN